jgi:hypothetical protein
VSADRLICRVAPLLHQLRPKRPSGCRMEIFHRPRHSPGDPEKGWKIMADGIERARWIAEQAAAVAESWFREVEIPEEAHPALLDEYAKGPPSRERYERIAWDWLDAHEWVGDKWQEKKPLPPLPPPPKPTVATLRAEIEQERSEWIAQGNDRDNIFWAPVRLARWWNTAAQIQGTPPPPLMPAPLPGRVSDIQQAIGAANVLLQWCDEGEAKAQPTQKPRAPGGKRRDSAALILGALCGHHKYDGTSIGNWEAVGVRGLSTLTKPTKSTEKPVSPATITRWFNKNFQGGHSAYERQCADELLLATLKRLNNEFTPEDMHDISEYESKGRSADQRRDKAFEKDNR